MKKVLALILAIVSVFSILALAGCGDHGAEADANNQGTTVKPEITAADKSGDIADIQKKGKIVVGITEYPPMNYKDEKGNWTGFDTELTQAFAKKLGVNVEFVVLADWGKKFIELNSGSIDCVWNGMTITDEAKKNSSVSDSYAQNSQVVVLPADKAAAVKSVEDLKAYTFAVEEGSAGQDVAESNGLKTVASQDMAAALMEANSGACDGCIIDKTMAEATVGTGNYKNLAVSLSLSTEEFGVSFRTGSDLTAEFNKFLAEYRENGELAKLAEKYSVEIK